MLSRDFHGFSQFLLANAGIEPHIRSLQLPCTSFTLDNGTSYLYITPAFIYNLFKYASVAQITSRCDKMISEK
jgi:hypothetical protein